MIFYILSFLLGLAVEVMLDFLSSHSVIFLDTSPYLISLLSALPLICLVVFIKDEHSPVKPFLMALLYETAFMGLSYLLFIEFLWVELESGYLFFFLTFMGKVTFTYGLLMGALLIRSATLHILKLVSRNDNFRLHLAILVVFVTLTLSALYIQQNLTNEVRNTPETNDDRIGYNISRSRNASPIMQWNHSKKQFWSKNNLSVPT